MYVPKHHGEPDPALLHAPMRDHPLGTWVTPGADGMIANHIPFLLDTDGGPHGTFTGAW